MMITLGLLFLLSPVWANSSYSLLSVYGFAPRQPQIGFFNLLQPSTSQRYLTLRDIYERPVTIITTGARPVPYSQYISPYAPHHQQYRQSFTAYYARHGLRSVVSIDSFRHLHKFFLQFKELSGLVFTAGGFPYHSDFLQKGITEFVFPDSFNVRDLLDFSEQDTIFLFIAPQDEFNNFNFPKIIKVASFIVNEQDVVPNSFVGTNSFQPNYPHVLSSPFITVLPLNLKPFFQPPHTSQVNSSQNGTNINDKNVNVSTSEPPKDYTTTSNTVNSNFTSTNSSSASEKVDITQETSTNSPGNPNSFPENASGNSHSPVSKVNVTAENTNYSENGGNAQQPPSSPNNKVISEEKPAIK